MNNNEEALEKLKKEVHNLFDGHGLENALDHMKFLYHKATENKEDGTITDMYRSNLTSFWIDLNNLLHHLNTFNEEQAISII
jgi:hypothetical protein